MKPLQTFSSWQALLTYLAGPSPDLAKRWVWYHAPLDTRPCLVRVVKVFKNGKLRIDPCLSGRGEAFTADEGHLSRFRAPRATPFPQESEVTS